MNKTVLITGTSSGFGAATVRHFAGQGWNVVATLRSVAGGAAPSELPNVLVTRLDVQDRASIDAAVAAGLERFGQIDVLVNNAGFGLFGVFEETPRERLVEQFDVNVFGVMDVTRAVLPHMRARRRGVIVNVSSGAGVFTVPMLSGYCASKFALEGFSEALSYELLSQGIVVKILEPGGVTSTRFGERSQEEASRTSAIADYAAFVAQTEAVFARLRSAAHATSEEVAAAIYGAATDGTDRLRYVATKDIEPLVKARRETSEEAYIAGMRKSFLAQR
jgi:NAD(P)-dependent dehydrogenase (short-subunit alcohol dehydrogenase family)